MNYNKIYASIVLRAQAERTERLALKKQGQYFENHHIIPRSLGGKNVKSNMAMLTGREHFICHWLLVKIYPVGSSSREKMLMALWRMQSINECHTDRYINSKAYESLRIEFANSIGKLTSISQSGNRNSQYGKTWYTNCYTGECISTHENKSYPWYKGRFLFSGENSILKYRKIVHAKNKHFSRQIARLVSLRHARELWDRYHNGNYKKLEDMGTEIGISKVALYNWFNNYIPKYKSTDKAHRKHYSSNKDLVGVYQ